jgi:hypothetical protein
VKNNQMPGLPSVLSFAQLACGSSSQPTIGSAARVDGDAAAAGRRADEHEDEGDDEGDEQAQEVEPGILLLLLAATQLAHGGAECRRRRRSSSREMGGRSKGGCCFFLLGMRALSLSAVMNDMIRGLEGLSLVQKSKSWLRRRYQVLDDATRSSSGTNSRIILYTVFAFVRQI